MRCTPGNSHRCPRHPPVRVGCVAHGGSRASRCRDRPAGRRLSPACPVRRAREERVQCGGGRVGQDLRPAAPEPTRLGDLQRAGLPEPFCLRPVRPVGPLLAADVDLFDLDCAGQPDPARRTSTDRSRCSIAHAVGYEPIFSARCRLNADIPSLPDPNSQHASNHTLSGVVGGRTTSAPSPTSGSCRRQAHLYRPSATRRPPWWPPSGHTKPSGQSSQSR